MTGIEKEAQEGGDETPTAALPVVRVKLRDMIALHRAFGDPSRECEQETDELP